MGMPNLVGVSYQEEQAGYFAGYATVMEGYTKLGFSVAAAVTTSLYPVRLWLCTGRERCRSSKVKLLK